MEEEIREVLAENEAKRNKPEQAEQIINPLDYVTIPIKEYRKLIKKVERVKVQNRQLKELADLKKDAANYRRWWKEEETNRISLEEQISELQKTRELQEDD